MMPLNFEFDHEEHEGSGDYWIEVDPNSSGSRWRLMQPDTLGSRRRGGKRPLVTE